VSVIGLLILFIFHHHNEKKVEDAKRINSELAAALSFILTRIRIKGCRYIRAKKIEERGAKS
jgi:hypothetical protein